MAAISKVVAVSATYPYQVVRARLQVRRSVRERGRNVCLEQTWD